MTAVIAERALPIRVPILAGESLDSWLEALARRNSLTIRRLLPALGWRPPHTAGGLLFTVPAQILRRIERQAGLPARRLDEAAGDRYLPFGPVRRDGSRYCPRCLAERDGRWLLTWRLPWIFACTTHGVLLHGSCPSCGQLPRAHLSSAGLNPAATCPAPAAPGRCCAADLTAAAAQPAPGRLLEAQQQICALHAPADGPGGHTAAAQTLSDLRITASWLLRHAPGHHFAGCGPGVHAAWRDWHAQPAATRSRPDHIPPASAALTGALTALAMPLLTAPAQEAISQIRALPGPAGPRKTRPEGLTTGQWKQLSEPARARFLRALDPGMTPFERIRHRSGTPLARIPAGPAGLLSARARQVPQLLWPEWAIRLMPARGFLPASFRATIASCLLLPGNPAPVTGQAAPAQHAYRSGTAASMILRTLAAGGNDAVFAAISCLASYLDTCGSPIDYQRRRETIPAQTITKEQWQDLCDQASAHPGEDRRLLEARRYLFQLLTGADLNDPRHTLAFGPRADRARQLAFTDTLTTPLRAALHDHAIRYLHERGISEPLTWQPPAGCCAGLTLPGRDPDDIDLAAVRQLVITSQVPPGAAAEQLGTTISHVRLALERIHRPAPPWGHTSAPVARRWQQRARHLLTRQFFEREYIQARKTIRQLETETGIPRNYLAERARQHGITLTAGSGHAPIDPRWLREQYLCQQRSYTDIAAELGVMDVTVIAAARRHGIPSRPPGVHSHPEMITTLGEHIPPDIRHAVEGTLHGWQRLQRFQAAMTYPTIAAAATRLGAHRGALLHQFQRLERDVGAKLYDRSTPHQPMRPTPRGTALLQALSRPDIQALAATQNHTSTPPGPPHGWRPPRRPAPRTRQATPAPAPASRRKGHTGEKNPRTDR